MANEGDEIKTSKVLRRVWVCVSRAGTANIVNKVSTFVLNKYKSVEIDDFKEL